MFVFYGIVWLLKLCFRVNDLDEKFFWFLDLEKRSVVFFFFLRELKYYKLGRRLFVVILIVNVIFFSDIFISDVFFFFVVEIIIKWSRDLGKEEINRG